MIRKIPFRQTLPFRLLALSFVLLALPLLIDSFIVVQKGYEDATNDAKAHLVEAAEVRQVPISLIQPARKIGLNIMEYFLKIQHQMPTAPTHEKDEVLQKLASAGSFENVFLLKPHEDNKFLIVASSDPAFLGKEYNPFYISQIFYAPDTLQRGSFNYVGYDPISLEPYFISGKIITSAENQPIGALVASSKIESKLKDLLKPDLEFYPVYFGLLLPDTLVFASSDPQLTFQYFAPIDFQKKNFYLENEAAIRKLIAQSPLAMKWIGYPFFEFTWKGETQIGYLENVPYTQILLLTYASKEEIFVKPFISFLDVYSVYVLILVIGGILAYIFTRRLARPMNELINVMGEIQAGNLQERYNPDPLGYEINHLGLIFNEMIDQLLKKKALAEDERVSREVYAKELRVGQQVQRSLLPEKMPVYQGISLAARYIPAKEVGGDFYDVFLKKKGKKETVVMTVADASGKGVQACFYSLGVRSMLRTYVSEFDDVALAMNKTNALFTMDTGDTGMFVTAIMAEYDAEAHQMLYYSCGHNPPLLLKSNGEAFFLNHLGAALGILMGPQGITQQCTLEKGDTVVFYSDGITEAHNVDFQLFGEERLQKSIQTSFERGTEQMANQLMKDLEDFVGIAPQHDDITLLIMKVVE